MTYDGDTVDRVPPHAHDAEQAVLGAMMRDREAIGHAIEILTEDDFHNPAYRQIFRSICALDQRSELVDLITVNEELKREDRYNAVGGIETTLACYDAVTGGASVKAHARVVAEKGTLRRLIEGCTDLTERCYKRPGNLSELIDSANGMIGTISARETRSVQSLQDLALETLRQMEDYRANRNKPKMPWGFPTLDQLTGGLRIGDYNVIGGQTSMGKTSFALNVSLKLAKHGIPVGIFTIEMTPHEIMEALICIEANVDGLKMVNGNMNNADYERAAESTAYLASLPIHVESAKDISIHQLKARTQRFTRTHGVRVVVLDYLQLMRAPKSQTREQEVSALSRGCKVLAQEAGVCMVVLSQLSRAAKMRENKEPELSDLRDSGSIEQDADAVIFCHRPSMYDYKADPLESWLLLRKQRKGPKGRIRCRFHEHERRYEEWVR